jgi:dipeptidyl aminopeptidase/acylaminoacyl peptidase
MQNKSLLVLALLGLCLLPLTAQQRAMRVEDMWAMKRIGQVTLSPNGDWLAFEVTQYNMDKNSGNSDIWLVSTRGGETRQLTASPKFDGTPRWKPDGTALAFLSDRDGSQQIYLLPMQGGEAMKLTNLPVDVEDFVWSPDGTRFAFVATIYASARNLAEAAELDARREESKVKARIIDGLMYRCFNQWRDGKHTHVFTCTSEGKEAKDLTPGLYDSPPLDLGGSRDFAFSPDSKELAFVRNEEPMVAISTNNDVFVVPVSGGKPTCLTSHNKAVDNQPRYSPDGRFLLYKTMQRVGFEADRLKIVLYDRNSGERQCLSEALDSSIAECEWSPDGRFVVFNTDKEGREIVCRLDVQTKQVETIVAGHSNRELNISPDGKTIYFKQQAVNQPFEIFAADIAGKKVTQLTFLNKPVLASLAMNEIEEFWFTSFDGKKVHGLLLKPPFFDTNNKYPLLYLIHGGPQGMWSDEFHYRWNLSAFAAHGYVVAAVNFRGSQGYGQEWCDAVSKDWGGGPYQDLMAGLDYLLATYPFIDNKRLAAAGASYGGYMINWIATQNDRFKVLVSHAGVFDLRSKYGATEELWFPEWEFNGTPYENPELYAKFSPSSYIVNFKKYKTPTLVIHGERDYRVPVTQAFQMFTALQRMGVPSRLIYFPDETHFITKPQNARLWWKEVFAWIDKWINQ